MEENEILEVKVELQDGSKVDMKIQQSDWWDEIEKGTIALIELVNGQQMLVEINEACEDEGVSFKLIGDTKSYHYDSHLVQTIYSEVK